MRSFQGLAQVYDRLMNHVDFARFTEFYLQAVTRCSGKISNILDLACGTGSISLELLKNGYAVTGLDISEQMLALADQKIYQAGFIPSLSCQDMREFSVHRPVDLVVCTFDSLNYLLKKNDLKKVFARVYQALVPGGILAFDVNSEYKAKEILGQNIYVYDEEEIYYTWQNNYEKQKQLCRMKLDIFVRDQENRYRRIEEFHEQRYYPVEVLSQMLSAQGFIIKAVYGDQRFIPPGPRTERIFFIAEKTTSTTCNC